MQNSSKVVLITGGASGIGLAAAKVFAESGLRVAIIDINDAAGHALASELKHLSDAFYHHCDVTSVESIYETVDAIYERFGRIDVLLNCAAITIRKRIPEIDEGQWDRFMDLDLKGPFFMAQACVRYMRKGGGGRIINFSSILSTVAHGRHTLYGGAKEGINAMTRELAVALRTENIQVVSVLPTYVITPMTEFRLSDSAWIAKQLEQSLNKELLYPRHITNVLHFLSTCSTNAFNGSKINLDAGYLNFRYKLVDWN